MKAKIKTKIKSNTNINSWVLKSKVDGHIYPKFTYKSRAAARKAAKGRRFHGDYVPVKMDSIPAKATKKTTTPYVFSAPKTVKTSTPMLRPIAKGLHVWQGWF